MRIISGTDFNNSEFPAQYAGDEPKAVAVGKFDGVHLGHRKLIRELTDKKEEGLSTAILTFDPSPEIFFGRGVTDELCTKEDKREIFEALGIDLLVELPFNRETAATPADEFVRRYLADGLHAEFIAAGSDLSFGDKGAGNFILLQELAPKFGYTARMISKVQFEGAEISSTRIRGMIEEGQMEKAAQCLGMPYTVSGRILHGRALGRTIGFPTINLDWPSGKLLPPRGVYASMVLIEGKQFPGLTNIGMNPTVEGSQAHTIRMETYLYDGSGDLYGKDAKVSLLSFRRPEMTFESVERMREQIQRDREDVLAYHTQAAGWICGLQAGACMV